MFKLTKSKKLKNEALFKKGTYSLTLTVLVLAALILINWFLSVMSDRFNLEIDMTTEKKNSISEKNVEYLKALEDEVNIIVCANKSEYTDAMSYYAQNLYGAYGTTDYFSQTVKLIDSYSNYNKNIKIKFIDPYSNEFSDISRNYSSYAVAYGDILVTSKPSEYERVKHVTFGDIYSLSQESSGYTSYYTVNGNTVESALTSAIAYVTSTDTKKLAVITGHSTNDYSLAYTELLEVNNYDISKISDSIINEIPSDFDAIAILSPNIDFAESELSAIAEFLDNNGQLDKGLIYFADATAPSLPNLNAYLAQWGIYMGDGIVYETDKNNFVNETPTCFGSFPETLEDDDITSNISLALTDYNVPMTVGDVADPTTTKVTSLMITNPTTVIAPAGTGKGFTDYTDDDKKQFSTVIQSVRSSYNSDNKEIESFVMAFSSVEFIESQWSNYYSLSNEDITLACTDRAANVGDTGMTFSKKTITNENFAEAVNQTTVTVMRVIFIGLIPIGIIALGIIVYVRRRNAQ